MRRPGAILAGWDLGEKLRGATRMLRIHEGRNGEKKVENHRVSSMYLISL